MEPLPDEVVLAVLGWLDLVSVLRCRSVCRRLQRLASDGALLHTLSVNQGWRPETVRALIERARPLRRLRYYGRSRLSATLRPILREVDPPTALHTVTELVLNLHNVHLEVLLQVLALFPQLRTLRAGRLGPDWHKSATILALARGVSPHLRSVVLDVDTSDTPYQADMRAYLKVLSALLTGLAHDGCLADVQLRVGLFCADSVPTYPYAGRFPYARWGSLNRRSECASLHQAVLNTNLVPSVSAWEEYVYYPDCPWQEPMRVRLANTLVPTPLSRSTAPVSAGTGTAPLPLWLLRPPERWDASPGAVPQHLTDLRLENVLGLSLDWQLLTLLDLPALQVLSLVFPALDKSAVMHAVHPWVVRLWDACAELHTVRLWGIPGLSALQLLTRRPVFETEAKKRVLDLGWQEKAPLIVPGADVSLAAAAQSAIPAAAITTSASPPSDAPRTAVATPLAGDLPRAAIASALTDAGTASAVVHSCRGLQWLRLATAGDELTLLVSALGDTLVSLELVLAGPFDDAATAILVNGAPRLQRLALVGSDASGMAISADGVRHLARLNRLRSLRLVGLPRLRSGDLTPLSSGCPSLVHLSLALVGPLSDDGSALLALPDALSGWQRLERLFLVQPGLRISTHLLQALEKLAWLRQVVIVGFNVTLSQEEAWQFSCRCPYLERCILGSSNSSIGGQSLPSSSEYKMSEEPAPTWDSIIDFWQRAEREPSDWWNVGM